MCADTSPSETPSPTGGLPRMAGHAHVRYAVKDGATRLAGLDQGSPLRVLFPRSEIGEPPLAAVTTVSGGLVGGDRIDMSGVLTSGSTLAAAFFEVRAGFGRLWFGCDRVGLRQGGSTRTSATSVSIETSHSVNSVS